MSENVPALSNAPATSLSPEAAQRLAHLPPAYVNGRQNPAYWKTNAFQAHQDLLRGQLVGARAEVGPPHEVDRDTPLHVGGYDFSQAAGAASMTAADRDVIDRFLPVAFEGGLGQAKVFEAISWALTTVNPRPEAFYRRAHASGWSDRAIDICLNWYRDEQARLSGRRRR